MYMHPYIDLFILCVSLDQVCEEDNYALEKIREIRSVNNDTPIILVLSLNVEEYRQDRDIYVNAREVLKRTAMRHPNGSIYLTDSQIAIHTNFYMMISVACSHKNSIGTLDTQYGDVEAISKINE